MNNQNYLRLRFRSQVGSYFAGETHIVLRPFADDYVRSGAAEVVRTVEEIVDARIAAGLVKTKPVTKPAAKKDNVMRLTVGKKMTPEQIRKLYGRTAGGKPFCTTSIDLPKNK